MRLTINEIKEAFEAHLMRHCGATLEEARLISSEFPDFYENSYLIERRLGEIALEGRLFEKAADRVNFALFPRGVLPPFEGDPPPFCFYTYYALDDMRGRTIADYRRADRLFQTDGLDAADFQNLDHLMERNPLSSAAGRESGDRSDPYPQKTTPTEQEERPMEMKFYRCAHCGQIIAIVKKTGVPVLCCGEPMQEIVPGTTDASVEKHVPVWKTEGNRVIVTVGAAAHPMIPAHYIEWIALQTKLGNQRKALHPGDEPTVCFSLCEGDEVEAVYAFCNLHSLWKG